MEKFKNALKKTAKVILSINIILLTIPIIMINGINFLAGLAGSLVAFIQALLITVLQHLE